MARTITRLLSMKDPEFSHISYLAKAVQHCLSFVRSDLHSDSSVGLSWRLSRRTHAASAADRIKSAAPVYPGIPIPTRIMTVERINPVFRASWGKSVMWR